MCEMSYKNSLRQFSVLVTLVGLCVHLSSGAGTVSLREASLSVTEGSTVEVCVEATLQTGDSVVVRLIGSSQDVTFPANTLMLDNTTTDGCWAVSAINDNLYEDDIEMVELILMIVNETGGVVLGEQSTTILSVTDINDAGISMRDTSIQQSEANDVQVCAILNSPSGGTEREIPIQISVAGLSTAREDRVFPAPSRVGATQCVTVVVDNNAVFQNNPILMRTYTLSAEISRVTVTNSMTTVTINDDDDAVIELVTPSPFTRDEDNFEACVLLRGPAGGTSVPLSGINIRIGSTETSVTFPSPSGVGARQCVNVTVDNQLYEQDTRQLTITLSSLNSRVNITGQASVTYTIVDDDDVTVSMATSSITQDEGDGNVTVCARLDEPPGGISRDVNVVFITNGASPGETRIFSADFLRNSLRCIQIPLMNNDVFEMSPVRTYSIVLTSPDSRVRVGSVGTTTVTINDDDDAVISMERTSIIQNEGDGNIEVCAEVTSPPGGLGQSLTILFTATGGRTESVTRTFTAGQSRKCVTYDVIDNDVYENNPVLSFTVSLSTSQPRVTATGSTSVTVNDDDNPVIAWEQTSYSIEEATPEVSRDICVVLMGPSGGLADPVSVSIQTLLVGSRRATQGTDFIVDPSLPITRPFTSADSVGSRECVTVTVLDDNVADPGESFRLRVQSSNSRVLFPSGRLTIINIINNDVLPGPTNLRNTSLTSRSVGLSWDPPDSASFSIRLLGYTVSRSDGGGPRIQSATFITINDLTPFQQHQFSVNTNFEGDEIGESVSINITTLQDAPEGPPLNLALSSSTSTSLTVSWRPPVQPNGLITHYTLYVDQGNGSIIPSRNDSPVFTISPLRPFQTVSVRVSASTSVGQGPATIGVEFITDQARSGPVGNLVVIRVDNATLRVEWTGPDQLNGVLLTYIVRVGIHGSQNRTQHNTTTLSVTINELDPFIPYDIFVMAVNGAGLGEPSTEVQFTAEGEPNPPSVVDFERLNDTAARVSWTPLSLTEARGFITEYNVTYWIVGSSQELAETISVPGSQSFVIIIGLDPGADYYFTVSASTAQGTSTNTERMILTALGAVGVIAGATIGGLMVAIILLLCIIVILFTMKKRQWNYSVKGKPDPKSLPPPKPSMEFELIGKDVRLQEQEEDVDTSGLLSESEEPGPEDIPLTAFADHVKQMHNQNNQGFEREYKSIKDGGHPWEASQLPCNKAKKNRFTNILPYDHCRVKLEDTGQPGSDYINANWLNGYKRENAYIAAQGPLPDTVDDFWRMIWENKLPTIVMVTRTVENGRDKCQQYWPKSTEEFMNPGLKIIVTQKELKVFPDYEIRVLSVKNVAESDVPPLLVTHFYYLGWPDHGVPEYATSILGFLRRVRKSHPVSGPPLLVHCSAGVGRTGTFIVLDTMLQWIQHKRSVNACQFVREMRQRRCKMVQTISQYVFIHDALGEFISCGDTEVAAHNLNIAINEMSKVSAGKRMTGFEEQFQLLEQVSRKPSAKDKENFKELNVESKNRYPQKFPYENHRPKLTDSSQKEQYINASFIEGYKQRRCFVATQAPLSSTVGDLWRMIWKLESRTIVMLCDLFENGKEMCAQYWPEGVGKEVRYGKLNIKLLSEDKENNIVKRKIEVASVTKGTSNESYVLTLFHYTSWNENGPQPAPESVILLNELVVNCQKSTGNKPIIVMCNDGCGRTGTFMSVYSVIDRFKVEAVVDVFQCVKAARIQRMALVANVEQYTLIYNVLKQYMMSLEQYANFTDVI